jgi:hypothetical protein
MRIRRPIVLARVTVLLLAGWALLAFAPEVFASEYFVNGVNGSDDNPGTEKRPWKTLSKLDSYDFEPGDTVRCARGSSFHGGFIITSSGTAEAPVVFTSYGNGPLPKFTNSDIRHLNGNVILVKGSHIVIDGLYFHNGPSAPPGVRVVRQMGAVFIDKGAEHVVIRNCEVYDYPIGFQSYGNHCLITRNHIHDCTGFLQYPSWGPVGIMVATSNHEISYNRIENYIATGGTFGADGGALEIDESNIPKENFKIHHNYSVGNEGFLELIGGADIKNVHVHHNVSDDWQEFVFFWAGYNCLVEHNTVLCRRPKNSNVHVVFTFNEGEARNIHVRNNIFAVAHGIQVFNGVSPYGPQDWDQPRDHNVYYCLDGSTADPCGSPLGEGDVIADPRFVDLDKHDLHLRPDSPAIDSGTQTGHNIDFDGHSMPIGEAPDIGAYEYQEGSR